MASWRPPQRVREGSTKEDSNALIKLHSVYLFALFFRSTHNYAHDRRSNKGDTVHRSSASGPRRMCMYNMAYNIIVRTYKGTCACACVRKPRIQIYACALYITYPYTGYRSIIIISYIRYPDLAIRNPRFAPT